MSDRLTPVDAAEAAPALIVLTNRSNVVDFLSSGLLRPKDALEKYYQDVSELADGVVPVVAAPVSDELIDFVGERPMQFPVAVEMEPRVVHPSVDPGIGTFEVATLDDVVRVHLASEEDRDELLARRFDNLDWGRMEFVVTPDLFGGGSTTVAAVRDACAGMARPEVPFELENRLAGGRLLLLHAAPAVSGGLRAAAAVVFASDEDGAASSEASDVPRWLVLDRSLERYAPPPGAEYDERVFRAAAAICLHLSRTDSWDGTRLVKGITQTLADDPDLPTDERARWQTAGAYIGDIANATRPFEGFTSTGYTSEGAVLLAALRGLPEDVLAWRKEDIHADEWTIAVAATLIGLVVGRTAIGTRLRPAALDRSLTQHERACLLSSSHDVLVEVEDAGPEQILRLDGAPALRTPLRPPTAFEVLALLDTADPTTAAGLVELAHRMGWHDAIRTTVTATGPFSHEVVDGVSRLVLAGRPAIVETILPEVLAKHVERSADLSVTTALQKLQQVDDC